MSSEKAFLKPHSKSSGGRGGGAPVEKSFFLIKLLANFINIDVVTDTVAWFEDFYTQCIYIFELIHLRLLSEWFRFKF